MAIDKTQAVKPEIICPDNTMLKGIDDLGNPICIEIPVLDESFVKVPKGDVEAALEFTWDILFMSPWDLIWISIPMTVLATYGLTVYFIFKWIQRKFHV